MHFSFLLKNVLQQRNLSDKSIELFTKIPKSGKKYAKKRLYFLKKSIYLLLIEKKKQEKYKYPDA